jgi:hydroxyacyl-ACP dehydratase HTD2-like protein with hotdog domain
LQVRSKDPAEADDEIKPTEIEHYKTYVGRTTTAKDFIDRSVVAHFAATLGAELDFSVLPATWHYGLFLTSMIRI